MREDSPGDPEALRLKAKSDALRLLSFRPRSVEEMRSRLRLKRKYDGALIEEIIESLKRQGFLNDEKFAQVYAQSRVYVRPVGRRQLEIDLKKKGLSGDLVRGALEKLSDYDEKKAARDLVSSRFQKMTGVSREKKKARLYGFLKRRGFNPDTIFSVMADLFKD